MENQIDFLPEDNKYFKWYWNICERAKNRALPEETYIEKHHVYPKSIYGENNKIVKLTAKEHYIVHLVLWYGLRIKFGTKDKRTRSMASAFVFSNYASYKNGKNIKLQMLKNIIFLKLQN
jgi:hypothetical protein